MSNAITMECRLLQLPPPQKAVLMCLADYCHDNGQDWHSIAAIMEWTCLAKTTVIDALKGLKGCGLISIKTATGRNNTTQLNLPLIAELATRAQAAKAASQSGSRTSPAPALVPLANQSGSRTSPAGGPHQSGSRTTTGPAPVPTGPAGGPEALEASVKHQKQNSQAPRRLRKTERSSDSRFELFYGAYPKKVSRLDAEKAFAQVAPSDELLQQMLDAIDRQSASSDWLKDGGKYIPHPGSWLRGKRWTDEERTSAPRGFIGPAEGRSANGVCL